MFNIENLNWIMCNHLKETSTGNKCCRRASAHLLPNLWRFSSMDTVKPDTFVPKATFEMRPVRKTPCKSKYVGTNVQRKQYLQPSPFTEACDSFCRPLPVTADVSLSPALEWPLTNPLISSRNVPAEPSAEANMQCAYRICKSFVSEAENPRKKISDADEAVWKTIWIQCRLKTLLFLMLLARRTTQFEL